MTREEAEAFLKEHDYVPGESHTSDLGTLAARVGTHREQPGDAEAKQLRLDIKRACRVVFTTPAPPPPAPVVKAPPRRKRAKKGAP